MSDPLTPEQHSSRLDGAHSSIVGALSEAFERVGELEDDYRALLARCVAAEQALADAVRLLDEYVGLPDEWMNPLRAALAGTEARPECGDPTCEQPQCVAPEPPIQKRGGYQPHAAGPAPTFPPPKPSDARRSASPLPTPPHGPVAVAWAEVL